MKTFKQLTYKIQILNFAPMWRHEDFIHDIGRIMLFLMSIAPGACPAFGNGTDGAFEVFVEVFFVLQRPGIGLAPLSLDPIKASDHGSGGLLIQILVPINWHGEVL